MSQDVGNALGLQANLMLVRYAQPKFGQCSDDKWYSAHELRMKRKKRRPCTGYVAVPDQRYISPRRKLRPVRMTDRLGILPAISQPCLCSSGVTSKDRCRAKGMRRGPLPLRRILLSIGSLCRLDSHIPSLLTPMILVSIYFCASAASPFFAEWPSSP